MTDHIEKPWALMRHHAGWADVFRIEGESADAVTGFYPDRETVGPHVSYSTRAVLARFPTFEAAHAAPAPVEVRSSTELIEAQQGTAADAPLCLSCGVKMRPAGSCYVCESCGSTSGCS